MDVALDYVLDYLKEITMLEKMIFYFDLFTFWI